MYKTYSYGHDPGNSDTCGVTYIEGVPKALTIPSTIAEGRLRDLTSLGVKLGEQDFVFREEVRGNKSELFVGDLAIRQAKLSSTGLGDISRYWSDQSRQLLLTVASALIPDTEFGLRVVTGLPVQTYMSGAEVRTQVSQALSGDYTFWVNDKERRVHVQVERILMEGAGALIKYRAKVHGVQGVIDIGGRTTDLYAADFQNPILPLCAGKPFGVENVAALLSKNFQMIHGRDLKLWEQRAILRAYASEGKIAYPSIYVKGQPMNGLQVLVKDAIHPTGKQIATFVSSTWNESEFNATVAGSMAQVLLIGGGPHYFKSYLAPVVPGALIAPNPHEANAAGYAAFAERQVQKEGQGQQFLSA